MSFHNMKWKVRVNDVFPMYNTSWKCILSFKCMHAARFPRLGLCAGWSNNHVAGGNILSLYKISSYTGMWNSTPDVG